MSRTTPRVLFELVDVAEDMTVTPSRVTAIYYGTGAERDSRATIVFTFPAVLTAIIGSTTVKTPPAKKKRKRL